MPASAENGMIAGNYWAWFAFRDANGYPSGVLDTVNGVAFANATTTSAYRLKHPISYTPPSTTRERAQRRGGQVYRGSRDLGVSDFGVAQFVMDAFDEQFHAYVTRTTVDVTTVTNWAAVTMNVGLANLPRVIFGMVRGITTEDGQDDFQTIVYHNCQIRPADASASQDGGVNPNPLTYEIVPDVSSRTGFGRLLSASTWAAVDNTDAYSMYRYADPIFLTTFKKDAIATTFTLPFKPTKSDATGAADNSITNNGTTLVVTSVAMSTGLVTLAAAGTAADLVVVGFPTRFVAP